MPTGAELAPVRVRAHKDGYKMSMVKNNIPMPAGLTTSQINRRKLFLNTFPRQSTSPAGPILQTAYTNYSIYHDSINWGERLPGCDIVISVKERADYTDFVDTRFYAEAMPRPRARVELRLPQFTFLTQIERDILGEILGPRYNWQTGKIVLSIRNLRKIHASINRCFQLVHEAMFRAIEIAPHVVAQTDMEMKAYNKEVHKISQLEAKMNEALKRSTTRPAQAEQLFYTSDQQHFVPVHDEYSLEQHLPFIPQVDAEKFFLASTIPPGLAEPLRPIGDNAYGLDPKTPVVPGIAPYAYMSREALLQSAFPTTFDPFHLKSHDHGSDETLAEIARRVPDSDDHSEDPSHFINEDFRSVGRVVQLGILRGDVNPLEANAIFEELMMDQSKRYEGQSDPEAAVQDRLAVDAEPIHGLPSSEEERPH